MIRFVSPVFFKELAQIAISKQATVLRCVFLGTLLLIFLLMSFAFFEGSGRNDSSEFGLASFLLVIYGQMVMVFIFTPIVCAGAIAGERQAGTLSLCSHRPRRRSLRA